MKITTFICSAILIGCVNINSNRTSAKHTLSDLQGEWVNIKYLENVRKTKSARQSQGVCEMPYIKIYNDTALCSLYFHEEIEYSLKQVNDKDFEGFSQSNGNVTFFIENDTLCLLGKENRGSFIRYRMTSELDNRPTRLLNKEIFSGAFTNVDSANNTIIFNDNGHVKGFLSYRTFSVLEDYSEGFCDKDLLFMHQNDTVSNEYTWQYSNDTLYIYKLDCIDFDSINNYCVGTKIGRLEYRLIKK